MGTPVQRRRRRPAAALAVLAVAAAVHVNASQGPASAVPAHPDDKTIIHVLNRIGFGPRPGDIERVRAIGLQAYIDRQLRPEKVDDPADRGAPRVARDADTRAAARSPSSTCCRRRCCGSSSASSRPPRRPASAPGSGRPAASSELPPDDAASGATGRWPAARHADTRSRSKPRRSSARCMTDLTEQKVLRAVYSERQLDEVMVDFWFNHFNVFAGKGQTRGYLTEYERDAIRPHVLGKFRDLLGATAQSPAMLFYPRQLAEQRAARRATDGGRTAARRAIAPARSDARGPARAAQPMRGAAAAARRSQPRRIAAAAA